MNKASISHTKNHLPEIVHHAEAGQDIQITRHGKSVAVIVSMERYKQAFSSEKGIFNSYLHWRELHPKAKGLTDRELKNLRDKKPHEPTNFSWD